MRILQLTEEGVVLIISPQCKHPAPPLTLFWRVGTSSGKTWEVELGAAGRWIGERHLSSHSADNLDGRSLFHLGKAKPGSKPQSWFWFGYLNQLCILLPEVLRTFKFCAVFIDLHAYLFDSPFPPNLFLHGFMYYSQMVVPALPSLFFQSPSPPPLPSFACYAPSPHQDWGLSPYLPTTAKKRESNLCKCIIRLIFNNPWLPGAKKSNLQSTIGFQFSFSYLARRCT